jgi:hypothetical protein
MPAVSKIGPEHLSRRAYIYVRQSSMGQVLSHPESARRQRDLIYRNLLTGQSVIPREKSD